MKISVRFDLKPKQVTAILNCAVVFKVIKQLPVGRTARRSAVRLALNRFALVGLFSEGGIMDAAVAGSRHD
jgi:hypothetical protein